MGELYFGDKSFLIEREVQLSSYTVGNAGEVFACIMQLYAEATVVFNKRELIKAIVYLVLK